MTHQALIVIQVRFNSKRLLGKALLPLCGVPVLIYLIRRLKSLPSSYKILVATTERVEDDIIAAWSIEEGIENVRGEEDNVLARYIKCIKTFSCDSIVRVTADNPLTDPRIIINAVEKMKEGGYDYVRAVDGYPAGIGVDVFTNNLLRVSYESSTSAYEREHIDAYVLNHPSLFKISHLSVPPELNYPDIRLTVDTYGDYKHIKETVESNPYNYFIQPEDVVKRYCERNT